MSDLGLPGGPEDRRSGVSRWRRALVYFGLAEDDPVNPLYPHPTKTASPSETDPDPLAGIQRQLDEQAAAIAELRAEVERLRDRER